MVLPAPELIWQKKIISLFFDTKKQRHPRQIAFLPDTFVKIAWVSVTGNGVTKVAQVRDGGGEVGGSCSRMHHALKENPQFSWLPNSIGKRA